MSKVFIVQNPMRRDREGELVNSFDVTPAREYGDLEVLLRAGPVAIEPSYIVGRLWEKLRDFAVDDWLLCLGDPVAIAAASAIVADVNDGVIPLLVWDRHLRKYLAVVTDTNYPAEVLK